MAAVMARPGCCFPTHLSNKDKLYLNIGSDVPLRNEEHDGPDHGGHVK
jgi:hypothetical protein